MRIIILLIIAVPSLMAMRTLGLLRDWIALKYWEKTGASMPHRPLLHETPSPGTSLTDAIAEALHKFLMSLLSTAAAVCFATAAVTIVIDVMGR